MVYSTLNHLPFTANNLLHLISLTFSGLIGTLNRPPIDPVGCFRDSVHDRAFPHLLESQRLTINWFSYESSLSRFVSCVFHPKSDINICYSIIYAKVSLSQYT